MARRQILLVDEIAGLREAVAATRRGYAFTIDAFIVLPDHLHTVWSLWKSRLGSGGLALIDVQFRNFRKNWRTSVTIRSGCSQKAKWPPRVILV